MNKNGKATKPEVTGKADKNAPKVDQRKLGDLLPDERNANKGTPRGGQMIEDSLRNFGAGRSILLDKHGRIIAGNKTVENAGSIGLEDVIVVQTDGTKLVAVQRMDLDLVKDKRAKELAIADNRAGQVSLEWDGAVLADMAGEIDMDQFFTEEEFAQLVGQKIGSELLTDEDAAPDAPEEPRTKPGDLYELGAHRLLCGDATVVTDIERLMDGKKADAVWTDPPYNIAYEGKTKDALTIKNDSMTCEKFREFLYNFFVTSITVTKPGGAIYVAHADTEGYNFRGAFTDAGWSLRSCLVWAKNSLVLGRSDYHWRHEPILYGWAPGAAHNWLGDRKQSTVLEFERPSRSSVHPTMKPVALIEYCLQNSSRPSEIVLDPFGGSGSTLIACEKIGRRARLSELDPKYCDVIVQRWEEATGKKAILCPA